ncbi:diguanylate cyclase and serine/threonine protein kinase with TPR repeats [Chloroherpeton thalassium ATCC 35110]|uniref:Diguanylate cyclase and serine/threonine protein kinase with TPR repeats n=1 Tax=Chloroherpeton thalassium (strain ATCC 35110 / GB-78) TaxID=517418 RepID=B3QSA8_CHLT3|nr:tetratricopeptide repeat-containing diguanylate cyclase [Chloroherpeton thalassium]ACF12499.1 diguanylate cyclase and serine/threonine protein kinase with TPR repeats [Chloroherpeton thalassium ATCC 35110]
MKISTTQSKIDNIKKRLDSNIDEKERVDLLVSLAETIHITNTQYALDLGKRACDQAKELCYKKGQAKGLCIIGKCLWRLSNNEEALTHLLESLWTFEEIGERTGEAKALMAMGVVLKSLSDFEQAIGYFFQSLRILEEVNDKVSQAEVMNNIGNVFKNLNNYYEALPYYQQSLAILESANEKHGMALALNNIGYVHYALGKYDEALPYFQQSIKYAKEIGDAIAESEALNNMGMVYEKIVDDQTALDIYFKSLLKSQEIGDRYGEARVLLSIGMQYAKNKDIESAEQYLQESTLIAEAVKARSIMCQAYRALANVYEQKKDFERALGYYKAFDSIKEELLSKDITGKINALKQNFELHTVQKELELFRTKNEELIGAFRDLQSLNISLQAELDLKTRVVNELRSKNDAKDAEPRKDFLTNLYTLRAVSPKLKHLFDSAKRQGKELSIAVIEIDLFKQINSRYPSQIMSEVLKKVAQILKEHIRTEDILVRYLGSSFVLLMPDLPAVRAFIICEKMRQAVESFRWGMLASGLKITVSFGLADDLKVPSYEKLIRLAEMKLQQTERSGGNQVRS